MFRQLVVDIDVEAKRLARLFGGLPAPVIAPGGILGIADAAESSAGQFDAMGKWVRSSIRRVARAHPDVDVVMIAWTLAVATCIELNVVNKLREPSLN